MNDTIIKVESLSKRYRIGTKERGYKTFREAIIDGITAPVRNFRRLSKLTKFRSNQPDNSDTSDIIWALKDVSFEVKQGEVIGIIGRNGAGKSTLLKILSRITEPTSGEVKLYGRVSSLLEVGTGFHPELTGRENIYLNGAVLGMRKTEIDGKFDEIVDFAEIEKFLDTPVKRYSSGMYIRLAFAVAAHLEPEILLVDEVLAVGDAAFQKKCLGKMGSVAEQGRTVLFVSHNMAAVNQLCSKAVLLNLGRIEQVNTASEVVRGYLDNAFQKATQLPIAYRKDRTGSGKVRIVSFHIEDADQHQISVVQSGMNCTFVFGYTCKEIDVYQNISVAFGVKDFTGMFLFRNFTGETGQDFDSVCGVGEFRCNIPKLPLSPGRYLLGFYITVNGEESDYISGDAIAFDVEQGDFFGSGKLSGHAPLLVEHTWSIKFKGYPPNEQPHSDTN